MGSGVAKTKAYAMISGLGKVIASYNEADDMFVIEANAPASSSWSQNGHVYTITLHAEDEAGNAVTMGSSDSTYGDQLKIRVLEKTPPVAEIKYPTSMSVVGVDHVQIELLASDSGGSGLNFASAVLKINGEDVGELSWKRVAVSRASDITDSDPGPGSEYGTYLSTYFVYGLNDGTNSIEFSISDNDGNESSDSIEFIVSTKAPTLNIISPADGVITNGSTVTISGTSSAVTSGVSITSITVNNIPISINSDGSFSYDYSLTEGENVLTIVSTDSAGNSTQVIRHITRDSLAPIITDVTVTPTVVDASGMIRITFRVIDPE